MKGGVASGWWLGKVEGAREKMRVRLIWLLMAVLCGTALRAADTPSPAAPMIKLLQSGRVPAERLGAIVDMVGKRGDARSPNSGGVSTRCHDPSLCCTA